MKLCSSSRESPPVSYSAEFPSAKATHSTSSRKAGRRHQPIEVSCGAPCIMRQRTIAPGQRLPFPRSSATPLPRRPPSPVSMPRQSYDEQCCKSVQWSGQRKQKSESNLISIQPSSKKRIAARLQVIKETRGTWQLSVVKSPRRIAFPTHQGLARQ